MWSFNYFQEEYYLCFENINDLQLTKKKMMEINVALENSFMCPIGSNSNTSL